MIMYTNAFFVCRRHYRFFLSSSVAYHRMLFVCIYVFWYPTPFPYQMFVSFNSNGKGDSRGAGTDIPSGAPVFMQRFFSEVYFRSIFLNFLCSELSTIVYVFCHYSFPHCIVCSSILRFLVTLFDLFNLFL